MTDQTNEIEAEGMRCLLAAMGATKSKTDTYALNGCAATPESWVECELWGEPWFVLTCLRFLESEKVRAVAHYEAKPGLMRVWRKRQEGPDPRIADPAPAVRIVKAAIAAARELEGGK